VKAEQPGELMELKLFKSRIDARRQTT